MSASLAYSAARERALGAALRLMTARHVADNDPHTNSDSEIEYAEETLALAARELVRATDALPPEQRPIGWGGEAA